MSASLFAGIDIGSTAVRIAVGQRLDVGGKEQLQIIGACEVPSEGVTRDVITSIEDAVSSVSNCLEKTERMVGSPVEGAWIGISGTHITTTQSKGVVAVSRTDGEIRDEDVARAIDAAQTVAGPVNYEVVHVIPKAFVVDGQAGIKDPVGMTGIRLEVDAQIVHGLSAHLKNLTKCVYRTGVNIERLVLAPLATAEIVTTPRQRELGVAVVSIGSSKTTILVFEQGDLLHIGSIPVGSEHVTSDIAIGLLVNIDLAERVKVNFANAIAKDQDKKAEINLIDFGGDGDEMVSLRYVSKIMQARLEELFEKIDKELKKIGRAGMLPAGVVLTGGGSKLPGMVDLAKEKLRLPVSLGYPIGIGSISDRVNDLSFTTAIGLAQWGFHDVPEEGQKGLFGSRPVGRVTDKIKKIFGVFG